MYPSSQHLGPAPGSCEEVGGLDWFLVLAQPSPASPAQPSHCSVASGARPRQHLQVRAALLHSETPTVSTGHNTVTSRLVVTRGRGQSGGNQGAQHRRRWRGTVTSYHLAIISSSQHKGSSNNERCRPSPATVINATQPTGF